MSMKFTADRPCSDPEKAARKIIEIANIVEAVQDGRIHIEKINGPFLFREKGTPAEYGASLDLAIARGWLELHESGTFVRFTQAGADLSLKNSLPRVKKKDYGRVAREIKVSPETLLAFAEGRVDFAGQGAAGACCRILPRPCGVRRRT